MTLLAQNLNDKACQALLATEVEENSPLTESCSPTEADDHEFTIRTIPDVSLNPRTKVRAREKVSDGPQVYNCKPNIVPVYTGNPVKGDIVGWDTVGVVLRHGE